MANEADYAEQNESLVNQLRIDAIRSKGRELHPIGECHWCEAAFEKGSQKVFCDQHCASDYEANKQLRG